MQSQPLNYNQARLSQLRSIYQSETPQWTNESLRILPEPEENYLTDEQRDKVLLNEYLQELSQGEPVRPSAGEDKIQQTPVPADDSPKTEKPSRKDPHTPLLMEESHMSISVDPTERIQEMSMDSIASQLDVCTEELRLDQEKTATVGTFNIEWLGTKNRSPQDYENIAKVIKDTGASLLGIQEISNVDGLQRVLKHLPDFGFILGKSNNQMVGVIFDKNRVKYDQSSIDHIDDVSLGNPGLRPPLTVDMKLDNFDFNFTVVHLKARFDGRSVAMRNKQTKILNQWLKDHLERNRDKDAIIVGDYNDHIGSEALGNFSDGDIVNYTTKNADKKGVYSNVRYKSTIDHGAITTVEGGAVEEYIKGSMRTVDENNYPKYSEKISDHKPIIFDFRTDIDND